MPMLILKFKLPEERSEAELAQAASKLYCACYDVSNYIRDLNKYDERESIPKEELSDKIRILLEDYYSLEGM